MSVRKRKDGRWIVDVVFMRGEQRDRVRKAAKTREAALKVERDLRARLDRGEDPAPKGMRFDDWAREFLAVYATTNNKPSERSAKSQIVKNHLVPFFGDLRIDRIGVQEIERFKAAQLGTKKPAAPKSINNRLTVLNRMFTVAHEWGRLARAPKVQWMKMPPASFRFLTFEEADRLLGGAAPEWRAMILVALRTGLRIGELVALRWEDVDLSKAQIEVRRNAWCGVEGSPKSGRARRVPLSPEALGAIRELPTRFKRGYVFGPGGEKRLTSGQTKWPLWTACKAAGLKRCGWHVLRHTFASHLVMRGVVLRAVQELLGHATLEMTMRYAHLAPEVTERAVNLLDGASSNGTIGARSEAV